MSSKKRILSSQSVLCLLVPMYAYLYIYRSRLRWWTCLFPLPLLHPNSGALGDPGSSLFNFIHKGIVEVPYQELESSATDADELGIEAGAEEVLLEEATSEPDQPSTDLTQAESESMDLNCKRYQFICDPRDVSAVAAVIKKRSFTVLSATQDYSPKTLVKLDQEEFEKAEKLVQMLEEHEDVIDVYDNFVLKED